MRQSTHSGQAATIDPALDGDEHDTPDADADPAAPDVAAPGGRRRAFAAWYRSRPLVGGVITVLAGVAMFFSSQLELGHMTIQVGVEGMQATILPIVIALTGVLAIAMPTHRIFYGVIGLVGTVYSLVAVNLGGFFVGFLLGCIGGVMVVSWAPRRARHEAGPGEGDDAIDAGAIDADLIDADAIEAVDPAEAAGARR